jgi:YVTN family beta-propeller protein
MVAVAPGGRRAFVANIGSGSVTEVDLQSFRVVRSVATGSGAEGVDVTPDGRAVWVTNRAADTVSVLDASTLEVTATLQAPSFPIRVKLTPDGRLALVSCARSGDVAVFDVAGRKEIRRLSAKLEGGSGEGRLFADAFGKSPVPIGIVVHPSGDRAFVAHAQADRIAVFDLAASRLAGALTAGKEPDGMAFSPLGVMGR